MRALRSLTAKDATTVGAENAGVPSVGDTPPPTLPTLPSDVLLAVLTWCDVDAIGSIACTSSLLSRRVDEEGAWQIADAQQCLGPPASSSECKARLRTAAECNHLADQPSSAFAWCSAAGFLSCACLRCGRQYTVTMAMGFVDTPSFASKLVTRAKFHALHAAPLHHRDFEVIWDRRAAAAAKQADAGARGSGIAPSAQSSDGGWERLAFFGTQNGPG